MNELNLMYKKKGYPYLFTEAKVAMALYARWKALKEGIEKPVFIPRDPEQVQVEEHQQDQQQADLEKQKQEMELKVNQIKENYQDS